MQNRKLGTVMCDAGTFKSDAAINIKNNVVFIDNASLIYAEIHTEFGSNFLEIDNKGEKTLIMRGNKISGLSKDALIKFDNSIMNHLVLPRNPENNEITIPGLLSTNQNNQAMHSFFNRKPSPPALTSDEKNLLKAAFDGEWKDIKELGKTPINLNVMSPEGYTPLYIASQNGHIRAVAELLRLGADVNLTDKDGTSAVWIASHQGYEHIVELLARHHADLNLPSNKATPLEIAIVKSHAKVIHILSHFININDPIKGVSPIYYAIHYDCQNGLEKNNKKEKNDILDSRTETLALCAANLNIESKAGGSPLFSAISSGKIETINLLLKYGVNVDSIINGMTPLYLAAENGNLGAMKSLLKEGANPDIQLPSGMTPLLIAVLKNHKDIVSLLINKDDRDPRLFFNEININELRKFFDQNKLQEPIYKEMQALVESKIETGKDEVLIKPEDIANAFGYKEIEEMFNKPKEISNFMYVRF